MAETSIKTLLEKAEKEMKEGDELKVNVDLSTKEDYTEPIYHQQKANYYINLAISQQLSELGNYLQKIENNTDQLNMRGLQT